MDGNLQERDWNQINRSKCFYILFFRLSLARQMRLEIEWLDLMFAREFNDFAFGTVQSFPDFKRGAEINGRETFTHFSMFEVLRDNFEL